MTTAEILRTHNAWRRGEGEWAEKTIADLPFTNAELGAAIDEAVRVMVGQSNPASSIIKIKNGPYDVADEALDKLRSLGWSCYVLRDDELYSHGLASSNFQHTYVWTVLCIAPTK
jgi:hypothetical protein